MTTTTAIQRPVHDSPMGESPAIATSAGLRAWFETELARRKPQIEIPGWVFEIRRAEVARGRGWWTAARDRGANHQARPILLYKVGNTPWRAVLAIRDVHPDLSDAAPKLSVETDLDGLLAVLERTPTQPPKPARRHRAVIARG